MSEGNTKKTYKRSAESRERDKLRKRAKRAESGGAVRTDRDREMDRVRSRRKRSAKNADKRLAIKLPKVRTGTPEYRRAIQAKYPMPAGMTKGDIRRMMEQAAANTAAMPVVEA